MTPYEIHQRIDASIKSITTTTENINDTIEKIEDQFTAIKFVIIGGWSISVLILILMAYHLNNKLDTLSSILSRL